MTEYTFLIYLLSSTLIGWVATFIPYKVLRYMLIMVIAVLGGTAYLLESDYLTKIVFFEVVILILQIFNLARAGLLRYQKHTATRVLNSGLALTGSLGLFSVASVLLEYSTISNFYLNSLIVFLMGLVGLHMLNKNSDKFRSRFSLAESELPTVSVLIPARNEDEQLEECIEGVLASDYPKLEIIVLDDCSQDKSSEIIKSFAQKGVRFIQGDMPKDNWLPKNQAYKTLADSASGDWYLFMGVDVRINKKFITKLLTEITSDDTQMACVMPKYQNSGFLGVFYSLRYYWELVLPLFIMKHPPSVSTCWVIGDEALKRCGGFDAVSQSVLPERYFAKQMNNEAKYKFYIATSEFLVSTNKNYDDQIETSERLLYPQLRKSIFRLLAMTLAIGLIITQYFFVINSLMDGQTNEIFVSLLSLVPSLISLAIVSSHQGLQYKLIRTLLLPVILIQELIVAYTSAYKYEFSEVIWKGRNVCYPLLTSIPKLPKV